VIIADASLIVHLCVDGEQTPLAEAVYAQDSVWVAPVLWRSEVRSALMKYLRQRLMGMDSAMISLQMAEETMAGHEYTADSRKVLESAHESKCSAYDCEYVTLAQDLGVPLVTADKQILKAFPKTAISLEKFSLEKFAKKK